MPQVGFHCPRGDMAHADCRVCAICGQSLGAKPGKRLRHSGPCEREHHRRQEFARRVAARGPEKQAALEEYRRLKGEGKKRCTGCNEVLPLNEFAQQGGRCGVRGACRWCESQREALRTRNPQRARATLLARQYNMTTEQYGAMLERQNGVCAVCGTPPDGWYLVVDHDHRTGTVRGLLCGACNTALGLAGDEPERLRALAQYLEESRPCPK